MKFRFETLLRLRKNQEELIQKDFGVVRSHLVQQQNALSDMENEENHNKKQFVKMLEAPTESNTLMLYGNYFQAIKSKEQTQGQIISEIEKKASEKRDELIEAMRKRKTLEILKDQALIQFQQKKRKQETAFFDEVASSRWHKRSL